MAHQGKGSVETLNKMRPVLGRTPGPKPLNFLKKSLWRERGRGRGRPGREARVRWRLSLSAHGREGAAVVAARAALGERGEVTGGRIADVRREAVRGEQRAEAAHHAVAHHLRDDRRRR